MSYFGRRPNPVFSDEYRALREVIIEARRNAGLSQRQFSALIGKPQSHVCCIERGQRRVDSLELYLMAKSLNLDPAALFGRIAERLDRVLQDQALADAARLQDRGLPGRSRKTG